MLSSKEFDPIKQPLCPTMHAEIKKPFDILADLQHAILAFKDNYQPVDNNQTATDEFNKAIDHLYDLIKKLVNKKTDYSFFDQLIESPFLAKLFRLGKDRVKVSVAKEAKQNKRTPELEFAQLTTQLLKDIVQSSKDNLSPLTAFTAYAKEAQEILSQTGKIPNFFKAVLTVIAAGINMILVPVAFTVVGIFISLPFSAYVGNKIAEQSPTAHKKIAKTIGTLGGIVLSPIVYLAALSLSPLFGAKLGYECTKKLTHFSQLDSVKRFLLFKPPVISTALQEITLKGNQVFKNKIL